MLLHVIDDSRGFGEGGSGEPHFSLARFVVGLLLVIALLAMALIAWKMEWADGSTAGLHMAEVAFGGLIGVLLGEKSALAGK